MMISLAGGVSPFGHPRINDRSHLPAAFRSVPRPSSPPGAKASTERPSHARHSTSTARAQDQTAQGVTTPHARLHTRRHRHHTTHASANFTHISDKSSHPTAPPSRAAARADNPSARSDSSSQRTSPTRSQSRGRKSCEGQAPNPATKHRRMEASGFEPLTPCLQSRCSTS